MAKKAKKVSSPDDQSVEDGHEAKPVFTFHANIPENCPPAKVMSVAGRSIYRLAKKDALSDRDLQVHYERDPIRFNSCNAFGFSCFLSIQDIIAFSRSMPSLGQFVYQCDGQTEYGKIQHTPSEKSEGHHTFWVDARIDRHQLFRLIGHVDKL